MNRKCCPHFTGEEVEAQQVEVTCSKATQPVSGRAICTPSSSTLDLELSPGVVRGLGGCRLKPREGIRITVASGDTSFKTHR